MYTSGSDELTPKDVLSVRVEVNIEGDTATSSQRVDLALDSLELRAVTSSTALEGLVTRVGRGAASELPLVGPVTVDVTTNTRASGQSLTVLAPKTVGGLGVDEACDRISVKPWRSPSLGSTYHQG